MKKKMKMKKKVFISVYFLGKGSRASLGQHWGSVGEWEGGWVKVCVWEGVCVCVCV